MCKCGQTGPRDTLIGATSSPKFRVIDFISEHDEAADQQLSCHRDDGFRFAASHKQPFVKSSQFIVRSHGDLRCFTEQEP